MFDKARRPSPAMVVALIALFVSIGGTSYATLTITGRNVKNGSLTGLDIKNNSLTTSDVKNLSLLARDFKPGQLPAGPRGITGPAGQAGATKVTTRYGFSDQGDGVALCLPNETVVGGGGFAAPVSGVPAFPYRDRPDPNSTSAPPTGWRYSAETPSGAVGGVDIHVLCAAP